MTIRESWIAIRKSWISVRAFRIEIRWSRIAKVRRRFRGRWSVWAVDELGEADEFLECANLLALLLFESGDKSPHSKGYEGKCSKPSGRRSQTWFCSVILTEPG